ncbi:MAG TPA: hypothetical protein PLX95_02000 [bacterium]|nr:hypothetical protein [bacterium]
MKKYISLAALLITISLTLTACTTKDKIQINKESKSDKGEMTVTEENKEEDLNGNIFDLLKLNKSIKCTFKSETEDGTTSGVTYVADGKTKTEYEIQSDEVNIKSYSVFDGEWVFTWTSENNQGTKLNIKNIENISKETAEEQETEEFDYSDQTQDFDYKCESWTPDKSVFELPKGMEFTDLNEMMEDLMQLKDSIPDME